MGNVTLIEAVYRAEDVAATRTAGTRPGNYRVRGAGEMNLASAIIEAEGPMAFVRELAGR